MAGLPRVLMHAAARRQRSPLFAGMGGRLQGLCDGCGLWLVRAGYRASLSCLWRVLTIFLLVYGRLTLWLLALLQAPYARHWDPKVRGHTHQLAASRATRARSVCCQ